MGLKNYRRSAAHPLAASTRSDPSDPYAAYLAWIADGRPSMNGEAPARTDSGAMPMGAGSSAASGAPAATILVTDHVQVRELGGAPDPAVKPSLWRRLNAALGRPTP